MITTLQYFAFSLFIFFLWLIGLPWLAFGLLALGAVRMLFLAQWKWIIWIRKNTLFSSFFSIAGLFTLAILLRVFIFEIYDIPSGSMEDALYPGDKILVSKLNYGPKMPQSPFEIPWINIFFYLNKQARAKGESSWWNYKRLQGYAAIQRGEMIVFQLPPNNKMILVKRCIGLPGNKLQILGGRVMINDRFIPSSPTVKQPYQLWFNNKKAFSQLMDSLKFQSLIGNFNWEQKNIKGFFNERQHQQLVSFDCIDSMNIRLIYPNDSLSPLYPQDKQFNWSIDFFGPLIIPAKGMTIVLDPLNYALYKELFQRFEKTPIEEKKGRFYLGEKEVKKYTFQQNYYFMMGDNRNDSQDSRYWGLVPEAHIEGKAVGILFSKDEQGFKWRRTMQML